MKFFKKLWSLFSRRTAINTVMWIKVPMFVSSKSDKSDLITITINHLEQKIKIK